MFLEAKVDFIFLTTNTYTVSFLARCIFIQILGSQVLNTENPIVKNETS